MTGVHKLQMIQERHEITTGIWYILNFLFCTVHTMAASHTRSQLLIHQADGQNVLHSPKI